MKNIIVLCEKRSQADAIAVAFSLRKNADAYTGIVNGDTWNVTWASGHLLELQEPEKAKPDITWHTPATLLPVTRAPRLKLIAGAKKSLDRIKRVAAGCTELVIATDPDREGEGIGRSIIEHLKIKTATTQRLWLVAGMDPDSIKKAASKLRPGHETIAMYRAQQARSIADWQAMFTTRLATMAARRGLLGSVGQGTKAASVASVGRVQTPTLNIVVQRDIEIENFVPQTHYLPSIIIEQDGDSATLKYRHAIPAAQIGEALPGVTWLEGSKPRPLFTSVADCEAFITRLQSLAGTDLSAVAKAKTRKIQPPLTYSLTKLQQAANTAFRITAARTLKATQSLYTAGHVSYPRTEHENLPNEAWADAPKILSALTKLGGGYEHAKGLPVKHDGSLPRVYSGKAMEHHGIMPTGKIPNIASLSADEKHIYTLISQRYVEAHMPAATVEQLAITCKTPVAGLSAENPSTFSIEGERVVTPGFLAAFQHAKATKNTLPPFRTGPVKLTGTSLITDKTKAPARYTEATLLEAMKNAGRFATDAEAIKTLRSVEGIGTPATRDTVIETLLRRQYLRRETKYLISTSPGRDLIAHLPDDLKSVEKTAIWESELAAIATLPDADAIKARDAFINSQSERIENLIRDWSSKISSAPPSSTTSTKGKKMSNTPTEKMLNFAKQVAERTGIELPAAAETDFDACKSFLDANVEAANNAPRPPSDKMISFAESVATRNSIELPEGYKTDYSLCKQFLDEHASKGGGRSAPTDKMLATAQNVAKRNNLTLPPEVNTSFEACKEFLNTHLGGN